MCPNMQDPEYRRQMEEWERQRLSEEIHEDVKRAKAFICGPEEERSFDFRHGSIRDVCVWVGMPVVRDVRDKGLPFGGGRIPVARKVAASTLARTFSETEAAYQVGKLKIETIDGGYSHESECDFAIRETERRAMAYVTYLAERAMPQCPVWRPTNRAKLIGRAVPAFKVVKREGGRLVSVRPYAVLRDKLALAYEYESWTRPKIGALYAFSDFEMARRWMGRQPDLEIHQCVVENAVEPDACAHLDDAIVDFWNCECGKSSESDFQRGKHICRSVPPHPGTIMGTAIALTKNPHGLIANIRAHETTLASSVSPAGYIEP